MPKKRTTPGPTLTLSDLSFNERFALAASWWRPGCQAGTGTPRFSTWAAYFATYDLVRAELLASCRRWLPFAELARERFLAGADPLDAAGAFQQAIAGRRVVA